MARHRRRPQPARGPDRRVHRLAPILALIVVASTLVVDPWGLQAFLAARLAMTICLLAAACWLLIGRGVAVPAPRWVTIGFIGLGASLFAASLLSRAPIVALAGASGRQLGFAAWLTFAAALLVGMSSVPARDPDRVIGSLSRGFAIATLGLGLVVVFEIAGHPIVEASQDFGGRIQGTLGNPAVLAAFVVMALPILLTRFLSRRDRWLTGTAMAVGGLLLLGSGTRGAWLAIGVALVLLWTRMRRATTDVGSSITRIVVPVLLVLVVGGALLTGRIGTVADAFSGRVATWEVAGRAIAQSPVFGVGPEGFAIAFAEHVDEEYVLEYTRDDVADRAHNGIIDVALSAGLIGLSFYLVVIAWVIRLVVRALRSGQHSLMVAGLASGVVAYLVQQQSLFQLAAIDLVFWLTVGVLAAAVGDTTERHPRRWLALSMALVVSGIAVYGLVGWAADRNHRAALSALGQPRVAIASVERAVGLRPMDQMHGVMATAIGRRSETPEVIVRALEITRRGLGFSPDDGVLILADTGLLVALYQASGNTDHLITAETSLLALVVRDRTNGEAFLRLGAIRYYVGDLEAAEGHWLEAARLMPHRPEPQNNLDTLSLERENDG